MRFFSRLVVICNVCFIASVILRYVEYPGQQKGNVDVAIPLPALENILVILGYSSIFLNIIFLLACLVTFFVNKGKTVPRWIYVFISIVFAFQLLYFFTTLIP